MPVDKPGTAPWPDDMTVLHRTRTSGKFNLPEATECPHPADLRAQGANQYGRWVKCLGCRQKLEYVPYSKENPPTSKNPSIKNKTEVVHVAKAAAVPSVKVKNPKAMATGGVSNKELETALEKQAGYVVSGIAEALQPLAVNMAQQQQSMHEALSLMRQQVNMVAASSSSGLPMQQQQMQMPVLPPAMFSNPQQHAIHSDQEMNPNESWEVQP